MGQNVGKYAATANLRERTKLWSFLNRKFLEDIVEPRAGIVERAFEIAKSGAVTNIGDLRRALTKEGYANVAQVLSGRSLKLQLMLLITDPRKIKPVR